MKALSVRQPFAGALALGWKDVENRSRMLSLRGTFLIHAGGQLHSWGQTAFDMVEQISGEKVPLLGGPGQPPAWTLGAIVGVAELTVAHRGCDASCSRWAHPGDVHHRVVNARPLRGPRRGPGGVAPMKLYIAGPMTGLPDFNYPAFFQAAQRLRAAGHKPLNPARSENREHAVSWEDYMRASLRDLAVADGVALLPGHERSRGARLEVHIATALSLPVERVEDWCMAGDR